jgi:dihydrodipicolinate synthase/N-acetylneuraminate lyase
MAEMLIPNLADLTAKLTADNERVTRFADTLPPRIESIVEAAMDEDWAEVSRLTDYLSRTCNVYGFSNIAQAASEVTQSIRSDAGAPGAPTKPASKETRRRVVKLVGLAGRAPSMPISESRPVM